MPRGSAERALARALKSAPLQPEDAATVELARKYARAVDESDTKLMQVGRSFLETLEQLGMTPKARASLVKDSTLPAGDAVDELWTRRERRA